MAVLAMATADLDDLTIFDAYSFMTRSTEQKRTGTHSYKLTTSSGNSQLNIPAKSTLYIRYAVYLTAGSRAYCIAREGTANHAYIDIYNLALTLYRLTVPVYSQILAANTWYVIEWKAVIHDTAGELTLKINGEQVFSATGIDTRNAQTGVVNNVIFYSGGSTSSAHYLDDILIDDANWPGLGGLEVLRPDADGHYTDWDSGSHASVSDDSDATYVATDAAVAKKDSYTLPALAADRKTPTAVGLFTKSQLSGAGAGTLRPFFRKSTTDTPGGSQALSTSLAWARNFQTQLPDEVGLEVVV